MIYEGIIVGRTDTLYGCYQVCAAVKRLGDWAREDFRAWWLEAVGVGRRTRGELA